MCVCVCVCLLFLVHLDNSLLDPWGNLTYAFFVSVFIFPDGIQYHLSLLTKQQIYFFSTEEWWYNLQFSHRLIYPLKLFIDHLLGASYCAEHLGYNDRRERLSPWRAYNLKQDSLFKALKSSCYRGWFQWLNVSLRWECHQSVCALLYSVNSLLPFT